MQSDSYVFAKVIEAPFEGAIARAKAALAEKGFGVLTEIDVAATMKAKLGADMSAYRILGACSPRHAYDALQAEPRIGAMLPCNVIVRQLDEGRVEIAAIDPVASMQAVNNADLAETALTVQSLLKGVVESL